MTNAVLRHDAHDVAHLVLWHANDEMGRHHIADLELFELLASGQTLAQEIVSGADLSVTDIFDMLMEVAAGLSWSDVMETAVAIFALLAA